MRKRVQRSLGMGLVLTLGLLTGCDRSLEPLADKEVVAQLPVFEKVPASYSGINFTNLVQENIETRENVFDFDYFYNGAGVGVADLDNDGLQDLVFTGNQEANRIYRNKGDLQFEDVTKGSGINQGKGWATGITFVDINQDGWLDIYICQGGIRSEELRKNKLFINQQDMTFSEESVAYGLADAAISTQAVFFDYDKDGDLDALVMNENPFFGYDPASFQQILSEKKEFLHQSSSHFYENKEGKFRDITYKSGLLRPSFGLGLTVNDFNEDGWLDIYMTNDYYLPDVLFINDQQGSFQDRTKEMTEQVSFFGMGVDVADINNDGMEDIFVLDMAMADHYKAKTRMASMDTRQFDLLVNDYDYQHQYMFNSLQLKSAGNQYRNIAQMTGLSKTDWSWAVLMSDFDLDGDRDIFVSNGYKKFAIDNDVQAGVRLARNLFQGEVPLDVKKRLYDQMPSEKVANVVFENQGALKFSKVAKQWGVDEPSFSNGAVYADLDNDGDLELVVNNIDDPAFLYKNLSIEQSRGYFLQVNTQSENGEGFAEVSITHDGKQQVYRTGRVRGYLSAVAHSAHFGLGNSQKVDTVLVRWPSGKEQAMYNVKANQVLEFKEGGENQQLVAADKHVSVFEPIDQQISGLDFQHQENEYDDFASETLLPFRQSTLGPFMEKGDVNGDGLEDLVIGGASGQPTSLYLQTKDGYQSKTVDAFEKDRVFEDMAPVFFDYENDGDLDLFISSGGNAWAPGDQRYEDRIYLNDGKGDFSRLRSNLLQAHPYSGKKAITLDYDQDGRQDLLVGNRINPQHYPQAAASLLLHNTSPGFQEVTADVIPELEDFGIVNDLIATDFDQDGWMDLVVVGEWTSIGFFRNDQGKFKDISESLGIKKQNGWWFSVQETDVNQDGLPDYVVGNVGLNTKYKTTQKKPLKVFAKDFDENGTWDLVLSQQYKGNYVPFRGRQCSSEQMPFIAKKFETFDAFAKASLLDVYGEGLNDSYQRTVHTFESRLLLNQGNGSFQAIALPIEAQLFPILAWEKLDINGDGYEDLIAAGNIYHTEVETPRLDAGLGCVLLSNQKNGYTVMSGATSGLSLQGNVKSIQLIDHNNEKYLLSGVNDDLMKVYRINQK